MFHSPPLRRLAFDAVVIAPAVTIATLVIHAMSKPSEAAAGVVLALLMYATIVVIGVASIGALYDMMDPKIATKLSILISVYSPLSLLLLVGHWTLTGRWLPQRWSKQPTNEN